MINLIIVILMLLSSTSFAGQINLPKDENGWTIFTPTADSRICYVSSVEDAGEGVESGGGSYYAYDAAELGGDWTNPGTDVDVYPTFVSALSDTRNGYPDYILFLRGETFNVSSSLSFRSGKDSDEPFVVGSYGPSGISPVIKTAQGVSGISGASSANISWVAFFGLKIYSSTRDPDSGDYIDGTNANSGIFLYSVTGYTRQGHLIEGCIFSHFKDNNISSADIDAVDGVTVRRSVFLNNYSNTSAHSQGLYAGNVNNFVIEENIFDHNGWLIQEDGDPPTDGTGGEATAFNHNIYLSHCRNVTIQKNIGLRSSSNQIKIANYSESVLSGFVITDNLIVDGEIGISIGASDQHTQFWAGSPTVTNNVIAHLGLSNPTNREVAWGLYLSNNDGGSFSNNLMIHQEASAITNCYFLTTLFSMRDNIFEGNIAVLNKNMTAIDLNADSDNSFEPTGSFSSNIFSATEGSPYSVDANGLPDLDEITLSGNQYYTTKTENTWFNVNSTNLTNSQWESLTGESPVYTDPSFTDNTRDVDTYMDSIGGTATIDGFITAVRAQDRYSWDHRLEADTVNDWIRAGFDLDEYGIIRRKSFSATGNCLSIDGSKCLEFGN
jgi:hypothetical protein